jgi:hypothetical protein
MASKDPKETAYIYRDRPLKKNKIQTGLEKVQRGPETKSET